MRNFQRASSIFSSYDYKKKCDPINWVDIGTKIAGQFGKLCKSEVMTFYSIKNESEATLVEGTKTPLEKIFSITMKNMDTITFTKRLNSSQP